MRVRLARERAARRLFLPDRVGLRPFSSAGPGDRPKTICGRSNPPRLRRRITAMLDPRPDRRPTAAALAGGAEGTSPIPLLVRRHRGAVAAGIAALVLLVAGVAVAGRGGDDDASAASTTTEGPTTTTEAPCVPLPYQPCGGTPAPHTDGRVCIDDHADYDGSRANGCEAAPDDVDGSELVDRVEATIVPADDVDRFLLRIDDRSDLGCNNTFRLTVEAPTGLALRVELYDDDGQVVGQTTSADGIPGEIAISDPRCFRGDEGDFVAEVTPFGSDRSGTPYVLSRSGSF